MRSLPKQRPIPDWKLFEQAVAAFVAAADPNARVQWNARQRDRVTNRLRQRDVWVEAKLCGLFDIAALISCKRLKRKLHEQDIEQFDGELRSSGAQKGVIYAYSGFNRSALEKAKSLGISCGRLVDGFSPDLPESISFKCYAFHPRITLSPAAGDPPDGTSYTWGELFAQPCGSDGKSLAQVIEQIFQNGELTAVHGCRNLERPPADWENTIDLQPSNPAVPRVRIGIGGSWQAYEAKIEACLLNGSYLFTEDEFKGTFATPPVDTESTDPGPGWRKLEVMPTEIKPPTVVCIRYGAKVAESILEKYRDRPVRCSGRLPVEG